MQKVTLVCDLCGRDDTTVEVGTHVVGVDGVAVEAEVCTRDWAKIAKQVDLVTAVGRKVPGAVKAKRKRVRVAG